MDAAKAGPKRSHFVAVVVNSGSGGDSIGSRFVSVAGDPPDLIHPSAPTCLRCRGAAVEFGEDAAGKLTMSQCSMCGGRGFVPRRIHERVVIDLIGFTLSAPEETDGQEA